MRLCTVADIILVWEDRCICDEAVNADKKKIPLGDVFDFNYKKESDRATRCMLFTIKLKGDVPDIKHM